MSEIKYDAFIAHCSDDYEIAKKLECLLTARQFKCWLCDQILPGVSYASAIYDAMNCSKRCILLVTKAFIGSYYFEVEMREALARQNERGIVFCIPLYCGLTLEQLPYELKTYQCLDCGNMESDHFINKLLSVIENDVPTISQLQVTHTGVGLAWSYFYGFLNIVLPGLTDRVRTNMPDCYPKMIIIIPRSCDCPSDVHSLDPNFVHVGHIPHKHTRSGNVERDYKSSVYDFTYSQKDGKEVKRTVIIEFATPVLSLYEMRTNNLAMLDEGSMNAEREKFKEVVTQILNYPANRDLRDRWIIVDFKDVSTTTASQTDPACTLTEAVQKALEADDMLSTEFRNRLALSARLE